MSHFTELQVNYDQKNESALITALEECFGKDTVEVHDKPVGLQGYGGDLRSKLPTNSPDYAPECHIVIRRKNVGSASNDVGYRRTENGKYVAYISDYDKGRNFSKTKQDLVTQSYSATVAERNMKSQGWVVRRVVQEDGSIRLKCAPGVYTKKG